TGTRGSLRRKRGADGEIQCRLVEGHGAGAIDFSLRIQQVKPAKLSIAAAQDEIGFHGFERCRLALLGFRKSNHSGNPLDFLDQIDISKLAVPNNKLAFTLQAPAYRSRGGWQADGNF